MRDQVGKPDRHRVKGDVDLQSAIARHQRVQRARSVADAANGQVLRPGREIAEAVAAERVGHHQAVEIREVYYRLGHRSAGFGIPYHTSNLRLGPLSDQVACSKETEEHI